MASSLYEASAPVFVTGLRNMRAWLDKAEAEGSPDTLIAVRLAEDMHPLPRQIQIAADAAKNAMARLIGAPPPVMPDTEASFDELRERCDKTIAFIESIDPETLVGAEDRPVTVNFEGGMGYHFTGAEYLNRFALPNFYFHMAMAYAILRHGGVSLGKPDYLRHLGAPVPL